MHLPTILSTILSLTTAVTASHWSSPAGKPLLPKRQSLDLTCNNRHTHWHGWSSIRKLFAFGDSYTTTYFSISGPQPNKTNPLGNPLPYVQNGTSADGPNWIINLATGYNQSQIDLYNFAYGGAVVNQALTPELYDFIPDFTDQVGEYFLPHYAGVGNRSANWSPEHALFATFFGINDLIVSTASKNDTLQRSIFDSYFATLEQLYTGGARNFLLLNVPPFDQAPFATGGGSGVVSEFSANIALWNSRLMSMAYNLTLSHADTTVFVFDTNRVFRQVMAWPAAYLATSQIGNTSDYCNAYGDGTPTENWYNSTCDRPVNEYFWLNSLHPTWPIHNVMAEEIAEMLLEDRFGRIYV